MKIHYFTIQDKTAFIPLKYLYGECFYLIDGEPQLSPLFCMGNECHRNSNCGAVLANRVNYLVEHVMPSVKLIIAYFTYPDKPGSIRAGVFDTSFEELPRVITCNRSAFDKFKKEGVIYSWEATTEFLLLSDNNDIIPVGNLIKS